MKTKRNSLLLVLTALIWGVAFVAQSKGGDAVGPFSFNCIRFLLGAIVLLPVIALLDKLKLTKGKPKTKQEKSQQYRQKILHAAPLQSYLISHYTIYCVSAARLYTRKRTICAAKWLLGKMSLCFCAA